MNDRIFHIGYRRLEGGPRHRFAPWPIARTALQLAWRRRSTKFALLFCLGVIVVHGAWLITQVLLHEFQGDAQMGPDLAIATFGGASEVLGSFVRGQFFTCALAMAVIAGGFVADDRHAGAFDLYFARPLTRMDYALGKCLAAAAVPLVALVGPALLLWFVAVGGTDAERGRELWRLGPPTLAASLCAATWLTGSIIGLSALGERSRTVGAVFVGVLFGLAIVGEALPSAGHDWAGYLSPERDLRTLTSALLEVGAPSMGGQLLSSRSGPENDSALLSLLAVLAQAGAGFGALAFRLKREVAG